MQCDGCFVNKIISVHSPETLKQLYITNFVGVLLCSDLLRPFTGLRVLHVVDSGLMYVDISDVVKHATGLEELCVARNQLAAVVVDGGMGELRSLDLCNNNLE